MMVSEDILQELKFLLISVLSGAGLVFVYDFFRIMRRVIPHGSIWIAVEDFLYWMVSALIVFAMIYRENDGLIRGFALGGILLGMLAFNSTISPFNIRIISFVLKKIVINIKKILEKLIKPLKKLKKLLKKMAKVVKIGLCKL